MERLLNGLNSQTDQDQIDLIFRNESFNWTWLIDFEMPTVNQIQMNRSMLEMDSIYELINESDCYILEGTVLERGR